MWKSTRKEDERPASMPAAPQTVVTPAAQPVAPVRPVEAQKMEYRAADVAHIGKSVVVKGELSGSEDLYLDGEVEGSIDLKANNLTIGPNGRVRANVQAKDIVILGKVDGNVRGLDRVELKKSAVLNGDISTQRIVIEDGAFFKGAIDIQKSEKFEKPASSTASSSASSSYGGGSASTSSSSSSPSTSTYPQSSLLDRS